MVTRKKNANHEERMPTFFVIYFIFQFTKGRFHLYPESIVTSKAFPYLIEFTKKVKK